jgi:hypothetical protein
MFRLTIDLSGAEAARRYVAPERLAADLSIIHRKIALKLLSYVIQTMPVDTGRARAGWTALLDRAGLSSRALLGQGAVGALDARAVAEGRALSKIYSDRPFNTVVANAVEYVAYLDAGTATIAPMRFVSKAIWRARRNAAAVLDGYVRARTIDPDFRPQTGPADLA